MSVARLRLFLASAARVSRPTPKIWPSRHGLSTRTTPASLNSRSKLSLYAGVGLGTLILGGAFLLSNDGVVLLDAKQKRYVPVSPVSEALRVVSFDEVQRHNTADSAWVVIHNKVSLDCCSRDGDGVNGMLVVQSSGL